MRAGPSREGAGFTYRQISPLIEREAYLEYSPLGKMPILRDLGADGDFALPDSSAICAYLDAIAPEPPLLPAQPKDRAWVLWLEEYSDSALLELCAGLFRCRFIGPRLMGLPVDEDGAQALLSDTLPPIFTYLEEQLADGRDYLWHGGYSLADCAVAGQLCMMVLAGEDVDPAAWPRLAAWHARMRSRQAFQDCLAEEQRFFDVWQNSDQFKPADGAAAPRQLRMDETDS